MVAAGSLGLVFLIALTSPSSDIPQVTASRLAGRDDHGRPARPRMERSLLVAIAFAFFGAGLVTLTTCSRMVFAMARDGRFPAHRLMRRVDPPHADPDPGDHPAGRRRLRPDGRAAR